MEVHHKHHIPKQLKEYITEFLMLFAAVTLGFFAENQREHYIERHREKEYMQSMVEDLQKDTTELKKATAYIERQILGIDTTLELLWKGDLQKDNLKTLYLINLRILGNRGSELSNRTTSQLQNAGGMRLIKSHEVANLISEYWNRAEVAKKYEDIVGDLKLKARDQSYRIFDQQFYLNMENGSASSGVKDNVKLLTSEPIQLTEYCNRLSHIKYSMLNVQKRIYAVQIDIAEKLLNKIKAEYN